MAVITSTSAIDWSAVSLHDSAFDADVSAFGNRFEEIFDAFIAQQFTAPLLVGNQFTVQMTMGGQLTATGTNFNNFAAISISQFTYLNGAEIMTLKGTFDSVGLTDKITEAIHTIDGQTLSIKGNLTVTSDSGDYTGTISSVALLTSDNYTLTLTGAGLTATRVDTTTTVGGIFNKIVVTGPGSATPLVQVTGIAIAGGLPVGFETIGDFLAAFGGGNDSAAGAAGNELLSGYGGNDTLSGLAGADTLNGGAGNDSQDGGLGDDSYVGGAGDDTYVIAQALDTIDSAADTGTDTVRLALAAHALHDLSGFANLENVVFTGTGAVTLIGNDGVNSLTGGAANDSISGGAGSDVLAGGAGNDTLDGGTSADTLIGGAGNDYYVFDDAGDLAVEAAAGGTSDTVELSTSGDVLLVEYFNIENLVLASAEGTGIGTAAANVLTSKNGTHTLNGGLGNDTYNVQAGDTVAENTSDGGTKDLVNVFLDGGQTFTLGAGIENLTLIAGEQNVTAIGNDLANVITGSGFRDSLSGGGGNDTISGGADNDTLDGGSGKNSLAGGLGDDRYITMLFNPTPTTVAFDSAIADTGGIDTQIVTAGEAVFIPAAFNLALNAAIENLDFSGVDGQNLNATGNASSNLITGNSGNNKLDGGAGADTLEGGAGSDTLDGGAGNDVLNENFGDDVFVIAQAGDSIVEVENSNSIDTVRVALAASAYLDISGIAFLENVVFTGSGAVVIRGNAGDNSLAGGAGADSLYGGLGNDTYGVNSALDKIDDEGGTDTVVASATYSIAAMNGIENLTLGGTAAKATGNGGANVLTGNASANTLDGGAGADTMIGGNGADTYIVDNDGDVVTDTVAGAAGGIDQVNTSVDFSLVDTQIENATVSGATGRFLTGNGLANKLSGGTGNDSLDGGTGNDSLAGGQGDDAYFVDSTGDKITEVANQGIDTVHSSISYSIAAAPTLENITLTGLAAVNATGNGGNNILIGNVAANVLTGGAGDDSLSGGGSNDSLDGGAGTDTAVYGGNRDDYTISIAGGGSFRVSSEADGVDTLNSVERISFADEPDLLLSDLISLYEVLDAGVDSRLFGTGTIQISFSFMSTEPSYTNFPGHDGVAAPNNDLKEAIRDALQVWADIANIQFNETTDAESVQFRFATELVTLPLDDPFDPGGPDTSLAAYAFLPTSSPANGASLDQGDVWINRNFFLYDDSAAAGFVAGTSVFATLIHEIGHALGLDHPFDDGGDGEVFLADGAFDNNNLYSIMAYDTPPNSALVQWVDDLDFWYGFGGTVEARTPMLYDISTIQAMYGANTSTRDGDTTYGTNVADGGYALGIDQPFFLTIWDGGGSDTIDVSHLSLPSVIDLRPGHFSSIGMSDFLGLNDLGEHVNHGIFPNEGDTVGEEGYDYLEPTPEAPFGILTTFSGDHPSPWPDAQFVANGGIYNGTNNLTIAATAVIENAIGGSGADQLIGNNWINRLSGRGGADTLTGGKGADWFVFDTALDGTTNVDRITDFISGVDKIELDDDVFDVVGLAASILADINLAILSAGEHIRYAANGDLFYDSFKFATLAGHPALVAGDFLVVA